MVVVALSVRWGTALTYRVWFVDGTCVWWCNRVAVANRRKRGLLGLRHLLADVTYRAARTLVVRNAATAAATVTSTGGSGRGAAETCCQRLYRHYAVRCFVFETVALQCHV